MADPEKTLDTITIEEWNRLKLRAWRYQVLHRFRPDGRSWTWAHIPAKAVTN